MKILIKKLFIFKNLIKKREEGFLPKKKKKKKTHQHWNVLPLRTK